jgi:hypothetical protein
VIYFEGLGDLKVDYFGMKQFDFFFKIKIKIKE